ADRRLYALRDVTTTVESIPLIASSIMSKKLAEGIDGLVLDVKVGSGAFMKRTEDAERLARALAGIGQAMGKRVVALLTGMDQPLGREVGNALEVKEAVALLRDEGPADLREVTFALAEEMVLLAGQAATPEAARARVREVVGDGRAFLKLCEITEAQGGDPDALADLALLPRPEGTLEVTAPHDGLVQAIDAEAIGVAAVALGAGRTRADEDVDPAVGITVLAKVGDAVRAGEPLALVHHGRRGKEAPQAVAGRVLRAYQIGERAPPREPLLIARIADERTSP
ncbi:MAG TPA: thymidine phosphorylase, partial [Anaeromyxobacteraceae bacterium]|nr:thymidine phosphorylase [Anaeromyxobacteraceae bacterium]